MTKVQWHCLAPPPGVLDPKSQKAFNFIYKVNFIVFFIPNFVCVLANERYTTYQTGFLFFHLGHAPGVGLWGTGLPRRSKIIFFKHVHMAYQIDGNDEQNRMKVKFSSFGQTGDHGVRSKGQISLNFCYHVNFKDFYTKLFVCSHK